MMSYFHTGTRTIIGAEAFHCPVRDGKEWDHLAMVIKLNRLPHRFHSSESHAANSQSRSLRHNFGNENQILIAQQFFFEDWHNMYYPKQRVLSDRQSYRVKPHEQLVLVSLTHYCASTPSLSTSWSRTTLQGAQGPGKTYLKTSFPLRCFQRLSLPHIATRRCHWRDNRYTSGASTPVLSY